MYMPEDDDSEDDNQLPFGLDLQLRNLLLNGANNDGPDFAQHNFAALNFFGPVFGGDEDFGFNPGDEDLFLLESDDDDSYMDDGDEDNFQKIFVSLQDSHVIRRLSFHKNVEGVYRFPKTDHLFWGSDLTGPGECYEEVYRLLEEVELLLKVWRRRLSHPYTAHISHAPPPPSPHPGEGTLREGSDYTQSDYEYDSDEEDDYDHLPPGSTNEALTKKKFCQSAKVFHQVFDSEKQMEVFLRYIVRMRKYIFSIMFSLFMDALPADTAASLPGELWEKVWKFSQNPYFRYKDSVPMLLDTTYYRAGLRASVETPQVRVLEQERLRELFGAIGNIHMIVFEVLYKNPCILQPSPMYELEAGEEAADRFARYIWRRYTSMLRQKYSRFQHLETVLTQSEEPSPTLSLEQRMEAGVYSVRDIPLPSLKALDPSIRLDNSSSAITGDDQCEVILLLGRYALPDEKLGLLLVAVSAVTGQVVAVVKTGHSYQLHLMEVASHKVKRCNLLVWKRHFCVTNSRVTYLHRDVDLSRDHITVWTWPLPPPPAPAMSGKPPVLGPTEPLIVKEMALNLPASEESSGPGRYRHNTSCTVRHSGDRIVIVHQNPYIIHSSLAVYSIETGKVLFSQPWSATDMSLAGVQNNRALLVDQTERKASLISIMTGSVIQSYTADSLNKEFSLNNDKWDVKFDSCPNRKQFLVSSKSLAGYKVLRYNCESETDAPVEVLRGGAPDGADWGGRNMCLVDGLLVTNCRKELSDGTVPANMYEDLSIKCHEIAVFGLQSRTSHSVLIMASSREEAVDPLLNELSLRWYDLPSSDSDKSAWDPEKRSVFLVNDTKMAVLMETKCLRIIDFDTNPRAVALEEAAQVWEAVEAERIAKEREEEARKKRLQEMRERRKKRDEEEKRLLKKRLALEEQFVGKEVVVSGNITEWRHTYGFARSKGVAGRLGRVFLHKSDVAAGDRKQLRKGTNLEYQIGAGREPGTYRAGQIRVVARQPRKNQELKLKEKVKVTESAEALAVVEAGQSVPPSSPQPSTSQSRDELDKSNLDELGLD